MKYKVGKRTFPFVDPKRPDWSKKGPRPLLSELWYPAAEETQEAAFFMAPALAMAFSDSDLAKIDNRVHVIVPPNDSEVPPKTNGHRFAEQISAATLDVLQCPADHYVFLCEATALGRQLYPSYCVDPETVSRRDIHQNVSQQAVSFFENQFDNTGTCES